MPATGDFSDRTIVQNSDKKVWVVVGASRGLGLALAEAIIARGECDELILLSRKIEKMNEHFQTQAKIAFEKMNLRNTEDLAQVAQDDSVRDDAQNVLQSVLLNKTETESFVVSDKSIKRNFPMVVSCVGFDASDEAQWPLVLQFQAQKLFYVAGGGPYGPFENKKWSDHQWAFKVNFLCPAFLLHQLMLSNTCRQIVMVGSAIAESKPDIHAASYAAAKHALKGLITSVQAEQKKMSQAQIDLRLFSPGYIDTPMLPANAWPRQLTLEEQASLIASPIALAEKLLGWSNNPHNANCHLETF